ncbi:hypothetical protein SAMN05880501_10370 [Ureibacillus xyleni]|uniref:N-formylglutamate amidohydrolase n=1 Tax=Ureibacillus xyleni TaxID=614648 RepID=A0A285S5J9_9BACL|nr:hypothetical protein [Ureibacillus xyleni]SOC02595.1 hypothetical protein SAMN05880501_10370 [Ureibacillus xyleni]
MDLIEQLKHMEKAYKEENFPESSTFELIKGELPVILSSPHSVTHFREGKLKQGEFMTGAIVKVLQKKLNCFAITKTKNDFSDPNYDDIHPYKEAVKEIVTEHHLRFLMDLHIMSSKRPNAIEIGTGVGKNVFHNTKYEGIIKESFESKSIAPVIIDELFTGGFKNTVCSDVSKSVGIPCIQIEINWRLLDLATENHQVQKVLDSLTTSIMKILKEQ